MSSEAALGGMPARLRSLLASGLPQLIASVRERSGSIDAAVQNRAVESPAAGGTVEEQLSQLEKDVASLRALVIAQNEHAQRKLRASLSSAVNLISLLPHLKIDGVLPPFSHLGWEITGELAAFLFHLIRRRRPKLVFELGSGSSTILFAAALRANGMGRVISVEHDPEHRRRTAQFLQDTELSDWAALVETPLVEQRFGSLDLQWYDLDPLLRGMSETIDILFVDGPPGRIQPLSRYPALPVLKPHLSEQAIVLVDDGRRDDEMRMVELWRELDISFDVEPLSFLPRSPLLLTVPANPNWIAELR
ncbi:MAG: class I SAM-dependent methyltransferase, partial [Acidobacteria bacterium]|nr:class I SAM-dependent methyltransferase [Acidobacteriota bacterium]